MIAIKGSEYLQSSRLYVAVFFTLLTAITSQASIRVPFLELPFHLFGWGILLTLGLTLGWTAASKKNDGDHVIQIFFSLIGICVFIYQFLYNTIDIALTSLLSWLLIAMCVRLTNRRTLYFVLLASFILVLYSASLSKDSVFLMYILVYVISVLVTLVLDYYSVCTQESLLKDLQTQQSIPVIQAGLAIALPIILISTGLYLLVPRPVATHYGFFPAGGSHYYHDADWQQQTQESDTSQPSDDETSAQPTLEVNSDPLDNHSDQQQALTNSEHTASHQDGRMPQIGQSFSLNDHLRPEIDRDTAGSGISNDIVLYMQGPRPQYLRGAVFDYFDGKSWHISDRRTIKHRLDNGILILSENNSGTVFNQYTFTVRKQTNNKKLIVIPPGSAEIRFPGTVIAQDSYGTLYSPKQIRPDTIYSIHMSADRPPGRPYIQQDSRPKNGNYLQLPDKLPDRIITLSKDLTSAYSSSMDKALAMEKYLRSEYSFSYQTVVSQNNIPLDEFLFETKFGHCEYFATALTVLLRAQNIPARLVTGYSVTTYNPITGYYEARVMDGHAWVEAWIEGQGWVTFEPTAAYSLPKQSLPPDPAHALQTYYEKLSMETTQLAPESAEARLYSSLHWFMTQFNQIIHISWLVLKSVIMFIGHFLAVNAWWILFTGISCYLLFYFLTYRIKKVIACYRVKQLPESNPLHLLSCCYSEMEAMLSRYGYPRDPSWTLRQYRREISRAFPELEDQCITICNAYNSLRYSSQMPESTSTKDIKIDALKILNHPFQTPLPARRWLEPLLIALGYLKSHNARNQI